MFELLETLNCSWYMNLYVQTPRSNSVSDTETGRSIDSARSCTTKSRTCTFPTSFLSFEEVRETLISTVADKTPGILGE